MQQQQQGNYQWLLRKGEVAGGTRKQDKGKAEELCSRYFGRALTLERQHQQQNANHPRERQVSCGFHYPIEYISSAAAAENRINDKLQPLTNSCTL